MQSTSTLQKAMAMARQLEAATRRRVSAARIILARFLLIFQLFYFRFSFPTIFLFSFFNEEIRKQWSTTMNLFPHSIIIVFYFFLFKDSCQKKIQAKQTTIVSIYLFKLVFQLQKYKEELKKRIEVEDNHQSMKYWK